MKDHPVIICGAGKIGDIILGCCKELKLTVQGFCDNDPGKVKAGHCGLPVYYTPDLWKEVGEAEVIISIADLLDAEEQLRALGYERLMPGNIILSMFDFKGHSEKSLIDALVVSQQKARMVFLRSVDLIITEKCSLRCAECSNLAQYYTSPKNIETVRLVADVNALLEEVDGIGELRIIGGEPMMNPDFHEVVAAFAGERDIGRIVIYTNGTILPSDAQVEKLKAKNVHFLITDYGELSKNIVSLVGKLEYNHIGYTVMKAPGWTRCSEVRKHERPTEENDRLFQNCCAKNTFTLTDGKLYHCPFSANAYRLGMLYDSDAEAVPVTPGSRDKILRYIRRRDAVGACGFCSGRSFGDPTIPPARQLEPSHG